jgi:hemoglobin-like flavoprotein
MLTDEHKQAIVRSWRLVTPILDTAVELFYKRLFQLRPDLRQLFPADMVAQHRKLGAMLSFIVKSLDWPLDEWAADQDPESDLFLIVLALGRRHSNLYAVEDESYGPVGEALVWALDQGLGQVFQGVTREAWIKAYGMLATTMRLGAALVDAETADLTPARHLQSAVFQQPARGGRMEKKLLLKGDFAIVPLPELLQVTSLGRQLIGVEVLDDAESVLGVVWLKGGMVVRAETASAAGEAAFSEVLSSPRKKFFRASLAVGPADSYPMPVGSLNALLLQWAVTEPRAI